MPEPDAPRMKHDPSTRPADRRTGSDASHGRDNGSAAPQADPLWYKDAVIYQLHIKSFFDANNDGIGDFAGLISKLDYIAELEAELARR